jgi:hypothetical protein
MTIHDHRDPEGTPPWRFMSTIKGWKIYRRGTNSYMATRDDYAAYFGALGHAEYWLRCGYDEASYPSETCWLLHHELRTATPWSCNHRSVK